ncbi:MAG: SEC-C metal-binding domain-containing protein, partial [Planctomycetota bacterium]
AGRRFDSQLKPEDIRMNRDELKNQLLELSRKVGTMSEETLARANKKLEDLFAGSDAGTTAALASGSNGALKHLTDWLEAELNHPTNEDDVSRMNRDQMELVVSGAVDDRFHPEMRRMERQILLNIVDESWKNHLLTMDHLRSSVGLKGYAQMDPKVEYKREGMRLFDTMWESIGERVTDLIFRMESFNEDFIRSTWVEGAATKETASRPTASDAAADTASQRAAEASSQTAVADVKAEPIRKDGPKIGRNSPCPCGSGKKYKSCCMRKSA